MEKGGSWDDVGKAKGDMTMAFISCSSLLKIQYNKVVGHCWEKDL
jgi:hypothetical protein